MAGHHSLSLKEEKFPPHYKNSWSDNLRKPGQKDRIVYDPAGNNKYHNSETTSINPPGLNSVWTCHSDANAAVRKLEWEKIQASPDPERALQRYNDFNSRWIVMPKERVGLFRIFRENIEYGTEPDTELLKQPRTYWINPLMNCYWFYPKNSLQPTYFGYSRLGRD